MAITRERLVLEVLKVQNPEWTCRQIEEFIKREVVEANRSGVVIPYSGGHDSTLVVCLCVKSVGPENVLALYMPTHVPMPDSKEIHRRHSKEVSDWLGITLVEKDITPVLEVMRISELLPERDNLMAEKARREESSGGDLLVSRAMSTKDDFVARASAFYSTIGRVRVDYLAMYGELENRLTVGAENYTEFRLGSTLLWGCDELAEAMPIRDFYRTQVKQLLGFFGVPQEIIDKKSDPDLGLEIDLEQIYGPAEENDLILYGLEHGVMPEAMYEQFGKGAVDRVINLTKSTIKHKRGLPHVPDLTFKDGYFVK
jgi:NAD+ synthase